MGAQPQPAAASSGRSLLTSRNYRHYGWEHSRNLWLTEHARDRWRERMPDTAGPIHWAVDEGTSAEDLVDHAYWARHRNGPSADELLVYAGETWDGTVYVAALVVLHSDNVPSDIDRVVVTCYRASECRMQSVEQALKRIAASNGVNSEP